MEIVFYNQHQHGDIILSRQGVRWIIDHSPKNVNFTYIHNKDPESVFVHEKIQHIKPSASIHCVDIQTAEMYFKSNGFNPEALWVSSWLGSIKGTRVVLDTDNRERYLLPNDNGQYVIGDSYEVWDNLETQLKLCKQNIDQINGFFALNFVNYRIPYPSENDLIVKWNSNPAKLNQMQTLLEKSFDSRVLICNSDTISQQRPNFIYEDILSNIISENPNVAFYFTDNKKSSRLPNVFYIDENVSLPNLNEIEYLSAFCDVIITSLSGPGCMVMNDRTISDPSKTIIYVCRKIIGLIYDNGLCEYVQTEDYSNENIQSLVNTAVRNKLK